MAVNDPVLRRDNVVSVGPRVEYKFLNLAWEGKLLDYYKDTVFCKYPNSLLSFFEYQMDKDYVCATTIKHGEQNELCYTVKAGPAANATGPNAAVWVTLDSSSMFLGGTYSLPQIGFMVQLPPLGKNAIVIDVDRVSNPHRIMIKPSDSTYTIKIAAGATLLVTPANIKASGDCTKYDSTMRLPGVVFSATLQTIGRDFSVAGEELASFCSKLKLWDDLDEDGNKIETWWHAELDRMYDEFMLAKFRWVINGEAIDPAAGFTGKKGMTGFMWALRARGNYYGYADTLDKADMRALTKKMVAERNYSRNYAFWVGFDLNADLDEVLDELSAGKVSWGAFGGDEEKWVNFGFKGWSINGFEFYKQIEKNFADPCFLGAPDFTYNTTGVLVPMDTVMDSERGGGHSHIVMNYLADEKTGYSRELEMRDFGVLRPDSYSGHCDEHNWKVGSTLGAEYYCMHNFVLVEKL